jgi:hypothetical protein
VADRRRPARHSLIGRNKTTEGSRGQRNGGEVVSWARGKLRRGGVSPRA